MLKAINNPNGSNDPGKDGIANSFSTDAFSMSLEYFPGDYSRTGSNINSISVLGSILSYSGNIAGSSWKNRSTNLALNNGIVGPYMTEYNMTINTNSPIMIMMF